MVHYRLSTKITLIQSVCTNLTTRVFLQKCSCVSGLNPWLTLLKFTLLCGANGSSYEIL